MVAEITRKVLQCDYPDCLEEESVERISLTIRQRKIEIDLCEKHQEVCTVAEVRQYAHRKPRTRGVEPMDPADIPRRRGRT